MIRNSTLFIHCLLVECYGQGNKTYLGLTFYPFKFSMVWQIKQLQEIHENERISFINVFFLLVIML